jgi:hypothetical protein
MKKAFIPFLGSKTLIFPRVPASKSSPKLLPARVVKYSVYTWTESGDHGQNTVASHSSHGYQQYRTPSQRVVCSRYRTHLRPARTSECVHGSITAVGEKQIDYNIDAFTGCDGAFPFFLDQRQPNSVETVGHGKVIPV